MVKKNFIKFSPSFHKIGVCSLGFFAPILLNILFLCYKIKVLLNGIQVIIMIFAQLTRVKRVFDGNSSNTKT